MWFRLQLIIGILSLVNAQQKQMLLKFIDGFNVIKSEYSFEYNDDGVPVLFTESIFWLRVFGNLSENNNIGVTEHETRCEYLIYNANISIQKIYVHIAEVSFQLPDVGIEYMGDKTIYFCVQSTNHNWLHQGSGSWLQFKVTQHSIPFWLIILILLFCLLMSSLFNGLCLGLISLNITELKVYAAAGNNVEQSYAKAILPVREAGNSLLCSLLLGCTLFNTIATIIIDDQIPGWRAVCVSTVVIVLFCEILPCAICARYGLVVGAKTLFITKVNMIVTFIFSYTLGKLLDFLLGKEITGYTRARVAEIAILSSDLEKDELNIISGAFDLRKKKVEDVMTELDNVFMLPITAILNFEIVANIMNSGYSRIPIYDGDRANIVSMLFTKDLAMVDPEDQIRVAVLTNIFPTDPNFVDAETTLDVVLKQFKEGIKGHMAFVRQLSTNSHGENVNITIGLVTLEDVIEEVLQAEIYDETDIYLDNRSKRKRDHRLLYTDYLSVFAENFVSKTVYTSPQLRLAAFQYLSTEVKPFGEEFVSRKVLSRLLLLGIILHVNSGTKHLSHHILSDNIIYEHGVPANYFVLILEGHVDVILGTEGQKFEAGPFTDFGKSLFTGQEESFEPDYTVLAVGEVRYIRITRDIYQAAVRATQVERGEIQFELENETYPSLFGDNVANDSSREWQSPL